MGLEWVLLVLPLALLVWLGSWIWSRRLERAEVGATAPRPRDPRSVPLAPHHHWSGKAVGYAVVSILTAVIALAAYGGVIREFAVGPSEDLTAILFAAFAVFGTGAALLIWQLRAAVTVPRRLRVLRDDTGATAFASEITPSAGALFGAALTKRSREVYVLIENGLSFWIDDGSAMHEIARLPKDQIVAVERLGLPRSAGVDEVVVRALIADEPVALHLTPFTRLFDRSRALDSFLSSFDRVRTVSSEAAESGGPTTSA